MTAWGILSTARINRLIPATLTRLVAEVAIGRLRMIRARVQLPARAVMVPTRNRSSE